MKTGTTWLSLLLRQHPSIEFTPIKEIHYFYEQHFGGGLLSLDQRSRRALRKAAGTSWSSQFLTDPVDDLWFSRLYEYAASSDHFCAEFSNLTCLLPLSGWDRIHAVSPNVKVLLCLRNPLERLWSHVRFHAKLADAADQISSMTTEEMARFIESWQLLSFGQYGRYLTTLKQANSAANCKVLISEDLFRDTAATLRNTCAFLGLKPFTFQIENVPVNFGPKHSMTSAFLEAARPIVANDLAELNRIGYSYPESWNAVH